MRKNFNNKFFLAAVLIIFGFLLFGVFVVDLGINSKYFIRKDFNNAFNYRVTGDCEAFVRFVNRDTENWRKDCESEKGNQIEKIRNFKIQAISYNFGSDRAFLQVELSRRSGASDSAYSVNYELKKVGLSWKIDQEKK